MRVSGTTHGQRDLGAVKGEDRPAQYAEVEEVVGKFLADFHLEQLDRIRRHVSDPIATGFVGEEAGDKRSSGQ